MVPPQHKIWSHFDVAVARSKGVKPHPDALCNHEAIIATMLVLIQNLLEFDMMLGFVGRRPNNY
ncbi:hypothetical protein PHPALM_30234 [Phytophthora palmivora]|uniref:Uncharacterized protein n=1 Tax=Phytophthora palmivora TaxID=4796 RepID=A0A2P4X5P0_9STRA|nr:hypothetical protein PHPALM_30234 [Phytophthora palmivora]